MNFFHLLAATDYTTGIFDGSKLEGTRYEYLMPIVKFANQYIVAISVMLLIAGGFLTIFLGFMIAKNENAEQRAKLRQRMYGIIVTFFIVLFLIWFLSWFLTVLSDVFDPIRDSVSVPSPSEPSSGNSEIFKISTKLRL